MLAGISAEYYLRLERGRAQHPSPQILDALARALQLDRKATRYLHDLAAPKEGDTSEPEVAAYGLAEVIDELLIPAIVVNRYRDVLAANSIARALSPEFTPGQNSLRWRLLDPAARQFFVNWDEATEIAVSGLRELSGTCPNDPRMRALIAELSDVSPRFREIWDRGEVGYRFGIAPHASSSSRRTLSLPLPAQCTVSRWGSCAHVSRRARKPFRQSVGGIAFPVEAGATWP